MVKQDNKININVTSFSLELQQLHCEEKKTNKEFHQPSTTKPPNTQRSNTTAVLNFDF